MLLEVVFVRKGIITILALVGFFFLVSYVNAGGNTENLPPV